jgi:hypothetical protein
VRSKKRINLKYNLELEQTTLGHANAGRVFIYRKKLWIVLNSVKKGTKLVRTVGGTHHKSKVMPSKTKVKVLHSAAEDKIGK